MKNRRIYLTLIKLGLRYSTLIKQLLDLSCSGLSKMYTVDSDVIRTYVGMFPLKHPIILRMLA